MKMSKIKVDINSIDNFKKSFKEENSKLLEILHKMEKESEPLNNYFKGKAGNLFNSTLDDIFKREEKFIEQINTVFINNLSLAHHKYLEASEKIKKGVIK